MCSTGRRASRSPAGRQLREIMGAQFQRRREELGMTQATTARAANVSLKYLGEIERGEANFTAETLGAVAGVLEWTPWTLFGKNNAPMPLDVHTLLSAELKHFMQRLGNLAAWLAALDPAHRNISALPPTDFLSTALGETAPRKITRGRPKKNAVHALRRTIEPTLTDGRRGRPGKDSTPT